MADQPRLPMWLVGTPLVAAFTVGGCEKDVTVVTYSANKGRPALRGNMQNFSEIEADGWRLRSWTDGRAFGPGYPIDVYLEVERAGLEHPPLVDLSISAPGIGGDREAVSLKEKVLSPIV